MSCYSPDVYYGVSGDADPHYMERSEYGRHEREGSISGSETSSGYNHYLRGLKDDGDLPDDPHLSLTSQTLNSDGTPKRPMNAFMIFARKRRPEISAANQMMRTGDVSKILSKEWNTMDMSEKKFYLDQAKKLKDNFNFKYPDYVYRRRPNNSRKKRKPEHEREGHPEHGDTVDKEDVTFEEISPVGSDDPTSPAASQSYHYSSHSPSASVSFTDSDDFSSPHTSSSYADLPMGRYDSLSSRAAHAQMSAVSSSFTSGNADAHKRSPLTDVDSFPGFNSSGASSRHTTSYSPQDQFDPTNSWSPQREAGRLEHGRASWPLLPALDTEALRQRSNDGGNLSQLKAESYSPQMPHRSWSNPTTSAPSSSSAPAGLYASAAFPTLTSGLVLSQSPSSRNADMLPPPMSHHNTGQSYAALSHRGYKSLSWSERHHDFHDHRGFTQSNVLPLPTNNGYSPSPETSTQWQSSSRNLSGHQTLPSAILPLSNMPLQPISSSSGAAFPSSSGSALTSAQIGYWDKNRYENR